MIPILKYMTNCTYLIMSVKLPKDKMTAFGHITLLKKIKINYPTYVIKMFVTAGWFG